MVCRRSPRLDVHVQQEDFVRELDVIPSCRDRNAQAEDSRLRVPPPRPAQVQARDPQAPCVSPSRRGGCRRSQGGSAVRVHLVLRELILVFRSCVPRRGPFGVPRPRNFGLTRDEPPRRGQAGRDCRSERRLGLGVHFLISVGFRRTAEAVASTSFQRRLVLAPAPPNPRHETRLGSAPRREPQPRHSNSAEDPSNLVLHGTNSSQDLVLVARSWDTRPSSTAFGWRVCRHGLPVGGIRPSRATTMRYGIRRPPSGGCVTRSSR